MEYFDHLCDKDIAEELQMLGVFDEILISSTYDNLTSFETSDLSYIGTHHPSKIIHGTKDNIEELNLREIKEKKGFVFVTYNEDTTLGEVNKIIKTYADDLDINVGFYKNKFSNEFSILLLIF